MQTNVGLRALQNSVLQAIEWQAARTPEEVMQEREEMISQLEFANSELWESGMCEQWFSRCDATTRRVSEGVNGYLMQELLTASRHCDLAVVELFRHGGQFCARCCVCVCVCACVQSAWAGAAMLGELACSGVGEAVSVDYVKSIGELMGSCERSNAALLRELREDSNAADLLRLAKEDAALGRMSEPVPAAETHLSQVLLNPRFGVEQEKEDGSMKVRAIDHLSWSPSTRCDESTAECRPTKKARKEASVNGYTLPAEKMSHDTLDVLTAAMRQYKEVVGCVPGLIKVRSTWHVCTCWPGVVLVYVG